MVPGTIMPPVHPGEILLTEFLEPLRGSQSHGQGGGHASRADQ
jgi:hypothetical protein